MYFDNGTNYVGVKRMLSELHTFLISKHFNTEFAQVLSENRIIWSLNTPTASYFGENWEASIKSLKMHLFRVVGEHILSLKILSTVLMQIEAMVNTQPLCRMLFSDPAEPITLTPTHFLNLTALKYLPAINIDEDMLHILSRHFWKRWRTEYLHTLQSRAKRNTPFIRLLSELL